MSEQEIGFGAEATDVEQPEEVGVASAEGDGTEPEQADDVPADSADVE